MATANLRSSLYRVLETTTGHVRLPTGETLYPSDVYLLIQAIKAYDWTQHDDHVQEYEAWKRRPESVRPQLAKLHRMGVRPTMSADELTKLTRD